MTIAVTSVAIAVHKNMTMHLFEEPLKSERPTARSVTNQDIVLLWELFGLLEGEMKKETLPFGAPIWSKTLTEVILEHYEYMDGV